MLLRGVPRNRYRLPKALRQKVTGLNGDPVTLRDRARAASGVQRNDVGRESQAAEYRRRRLGPGTGSSGPCKGPGISGFGWSGPERLSP